MIPEIVVCCWWICMKAPFLKISLKGESMRVTQWIYVERCQNSQVGIQNGGAGIKDKVLRSSPSKHLKQNQRYSNHLKNVTIFFCYLTERSILLTAFFFLLYFPLLYLPEVRQHRKEW